MSNFLLVISTQEASRKCGWRVESVSCDKCRVISTVERARLYYFIVHGRLCLMWGDILRDDSTSRLSMVSAVAGSNLRPFPYLGLAH